MKSLMLKDFYVLRKSFWLYALIVAAMQLMPNGMGGFIAILYAAILPLAAFAYDDKSKWDIMEMTMPYSTRQIVLSRYCVGWISTLCVMSLSALTRLGALIAYDRLSMSPEVWEGFGSVRGTLSGFALSLCLMALSMPVFFRFDAEKSRTVRTLTIVILCGVIGGGIGVTTVRNMAFTEQLFNGGFEQSLWPEYLVTAVLTAVSIPLSMLAWKRRHR